MKYVNEKIYYIVPIVILLFDMIVMWVALIFRERFIDNLAKEDADLFKQKYHGLNILDALKGNPDDFRKIMRSEYYLLIVLDKNSVKGHKLLAIYRNFFFAFIVLSITFFLYFMYFAFTYQ